MCSTYTAILVTLLLGYEVNLLVEKPIRLQNTEYLLQNTEYLYNNQWYIKSNDIHDFYHAYDKNIT